jgi:hypothetical protein
VRPFRAEIALTLAAEDIDHAIEILESVTDRIEDDRRVNFEGDNLEEMAEHDIINGSPLDLQLRGADGAAGSRTP